MKRFLTVLVASMFLASAAIAAEKMGEEKTPAAKETETKGEKKAVKGEKTAKGDKTAKGESETKGEGKMTKGEGKKSSDTK
jgi:hypothetical protein